MVMIKNVIELRTEGEMEKVGGVEVMLLNSMTFTDGFKGMFLMEKG